MVDSRAGAGITQNWSGASDSANAQKKKKKKYFEKVLRADLKEFSMPKLKQNKLL